MIINTNIKLKNANFPFSKKNQNQANNKNNFENKYTSQL